MAEYITDLRTQAMAARSAARKLAYADTASKNRALASIAQAVQARQPDILRANKTDCEAARSSGMSNAMVDRLMLDAKRINAISEDVLKVMALPDPIGEMIEMRKMPNGLVIGKKRVPLGVIAAIYESRPNVTIDISSLCLKSGNGLILRGGKEAFNSNKILAEIVKQACLDCGLPGEAVQFIENTDREIVNDLLEMNDLIDLVIPRGGAGLINHVRKFSSIPVIAGGIGVCHTYVDDSANLEEAVNIVINAKTQRPTVCNALDTVIVHSAIADLFLPPLATKLAGYGVDIHADHHSQAIINNAGIKCSLATPQDWGKEFLDLIIAVKTVDSLDQALAHIETYGSGHSEAIISQHYPTIMRFLDEVDAACVYANASTRFTDGSQFGLGAEIGISTQKMHARGPLGLKEITSYKWIIFGQGHVRP